MRRPWVLSLVLLLVAAAVASGAPRVVPGWPVVAPAGPVLPGPGGGVVVAGSTTGGTLGDPYVTSAVRRDGRMLWRDSRELGCGNCDFGQTPVALQPDGTYGPIGATGDDFWAVTQDGREVAGCPDVVLVDGTCIVGSWMPDGILGPLRWTVLALRDGQTVWRHEEQDFTGSTEGDLGPPVIADGTGRVYVSLGRPVVVTSAPRLLVLDASTGAVLVRRPGDFAPLVALEDGILARSADGRALVALGADGGERWRVGVGPREWIRPAGILLDPRRHLLYVTRWSTDPAFRLRGRVSAIDTRTGAVRWRTSGGESAWVASVAEGGPLIAVERAKRREVRAHAASGRLLWRYRTAVAVEGAREIGDGTVVVATADDLVTRLDPRRRAPRVRRARISLGSRRFRTECVGACGVPPLSGTLLRIALPRPAVVKVRVLLPGQPPGDRWLQIAAPAGRTVTRILANRSLDRFRDGKRIRYRRATIDVRWRDRGRERVRRFPISAAPPPR